MNPHKPSSSGDPKGAEPSLTLLRPAPRIQVLDKPELQAIKMTCDSVINPKLERYPMIAEAFSTTSFNVICGKMGQGKTSLVTSLVKTVFKKCFHEIFVIIPSNSRESIENDIYGRYLPKDQLFDDLTEPVLDEVYARVKANSSEGYYSLLILDDFQANMKDPGVVKGLEKIITKMRHLRTTIFLLQQNWIALERKLRNLVSNIIFFNLGKVQLENIFVEVMQIDKSKYQELVDLAFQNPHDWVLVNLHKTRGIYRMFDRILF